MRRFIILTAAVALLILPLETWASGPGVGGRRVRLDNEQAGPYLLRAVTSPTPPTVGNFNVEVRVEDRSGLVIEEAHVTISAVPSDHEASEMQVIATHEFAPLPTEYAAHLALPTAGLWEVTVRVDSPLGVGQVSFFQRIARPTSISAWLSIGAPVAGLLLLALLFFWLQRQSEHEKESVNQASRQR